MCIRSVLNKSLKPSAFRNGNFLLIYPFRHHCSTREAHYYAEAKENTSGIVFHGFLQFIFREPFGGKPLPLPMGREGRRRLGLGLPSRLAIMRFTFALAFMSRAVLAL